MSRIEWSGDSMALRESLTCRTSVRFSLLTGGIAAAMGLMGTMVWAGIPEIANQHRAAYDLHVGAKHEAALGDLNLKYVAALERATMTASQAGKLEDAVALRAEAQRVKEHKPLSGSEQNAHPSVSSLRITYDEQVRLLMANRDLAAAPILARFDAELAAYQDELTKLGKLDEALEVKGYRASGLASKLYQTSGGAGSETPQGANLAMFQDGILGHSLYEARELRNFPKNANLVLDHTWLEAGDDAILEAKRLGLKVILAFADEDRTTVEEKGFPLALAHADNVVGVCWRAPYFDGTKPDDVAAFGKKVHAASPALQFWCSFVEKPRGKYETNPIPPEVDVIVVTSYFAPDANVVQEKALDVLPGFIQKAKGRPILLEWNAGGPRAPGLIPQTKPGTMKAMQKARDDNKAAGLILGQFGKRPEGIVGLEESRELTSEIENEVTRSTSAANR